MSGPLYQGTAADLRELVASLSPGDRLPSEASLMAELGATRGTVRAALQLLEREGALIGHQGRGWFVRSRDPVIWFASWPEDNADETIKPNDAWSRGAREQGRTPSERLEVAICEAEPCIASRLGLTDPLVWVRRRVRLVDGVINHRYDTYYPAALVAGTPIAMPGDVAPGVHAVLEALGRGWRTRRDEISTRPATGGEADLFGCISGEPVTEVIRTRRDAGGLPVAVTVVVGLWSRFKIVYEEGS